MRLGILSDTHGDVLGTRRAVRLFESLGVEMVIHCGDVGTAEILALLSPWPVHYVLGNVDGKFPPSPEGDQTGHVCHDRFGSLTVAGRSVALLHGDDTTRLRNAIESGQWDLVCHGHTHSPTHRYDGKTCILNPGAVSRTHEPSIATLDLPALRANHVSLA